MQFNCKTKPHFLRREDIPFCILFINVYGLYAHCTPQFTLELDVADTYSRVHIHKIRNILHVAYPLSQLNFRSFCVPKYFTTLTPRRLFLNQKGVFFMARSPRFYFIFSYFMFESCAFVGASLPVPLFCVCVYFIV